MEAIDLGQSRESLGGSPAIEAPDGPRYPTLCIDTDTELDIPDGGEMTTKFRKVATSENARDSKSPSYSCTIEVQKIVDIKPEADEEGEPEGLDPDLKLSMEDILGTKA